MSDDRRHFLVALTIYKSNSNKEVGRNAQLVRPHNDQKK